MKAAARVTLAAVAKRSTTLLALLIAVLALSACGGGGSSAVGGSDNGSSQGQDSAANLVPDTTPVFIAVDTDVSSGQLKDADALLQKFPARAQLLRQIRTSAQQNGIPLSKVTHSIGPETDIAVLNVKRGAAVGFTKPKDEAAFDTILESGKNPAVHTKIEGWTVFADKQADLDLVKNIDAKLSDAQPFKDAMASLPDTAIAKAFVARSALKDGLTGLQQAASASNAAMGFDKADWVSAAALSHDSGMEVQIHAHGKQAVAAAKTFKSTFTDLIPSDALLAISFDGAGNQLKQVENGSVPQVQQAEKALGVTLADLEELLAGEGALYVRAGNPIPEVTILAQESDEARAERTINRIVARVAHGAVTPTPRTVDGVALQQLSLGPVSIIYGTFDGKLVVTDNANAIRELKRTDDKLADSATFKDAKDAAGLPDETAGWIYANLKDAVPVIESLSQLGGGQLPARLDANLRPLRSFVAYGKTEGELVSAVLFLQTN